MAWVVVVVERVELVDGTGTLHVVVSATLVEEYLSSLKNMG